MVAKSFPRKHVLTKIFIKFLLVENFLWLQNHFLENRFIPTFSSNIFWLKMFYCCKIISAKTCSYQNFHKIFLGRKCFIFTKSFPRKVFPTKIFIKVFLVENFFGCNIIFSRTGSYQIFHQIFFGRKFFMVAKSYSRKQVPTKIFIKFFLVENFLWLQNHFLENMFLPKFSSNIFLVENFLLLQIHFLENRFLPKFSSNFFWSKMFYGCKIIFSKTGSFQNFHQIFFWSNIFYGCKIISSRTGSCQHFHQNFFGRKCFMVAISFSRKQVPNKIFIKFFFS